MPTGVHPIPNGWGFTCGPCGATYGAAPLKSRDDARAAFKTHRTKCKAGSVVGSIPAKAPAEPKAEPSPKKEATKVGAKARKKVGAKKATAKKATTKKGKGPAARSTNGAKKMWRIGFIPSAHNKKREVTPNVNKHGKLFPSDALRLGIIKVKKWGRVRAVMRREALALLRAGKGEFFTSKKGEK